MRPTPPIARFILLVAGGTLAVAGGPRPAAREMTDRLQRAVPDVQARYGALPLRFEANTGQTDRQVKFLSRGSGYSLFLTSSEAVLVLRAPRTDPKVADRSPQSGVPHEGAVLRMSLVGAKPMPPVTGLDRMPSTSSYFIGNDPARWRTNVPSFAKVRYEDVYPGVDLVYYGNQHQLEYDFVVAPGADPSRIALDFAGADRREIDARGDLVLGIGSEQVRFEKPLIYQMADATRHEVSGHYVLKGDGQVGFDVAAYDATRPLVIDPVLSYSTYLGGTSLDMGLGLAVDSSGSVYVTGRTASTDFPATAGAFDVTGDVSYDAFVVKLDPTASGADSLVYATYLGGGPFQEDQGLGIAVDSAHNAYVTGFTGANNFPTTPSAYKTTHSSGVTDVFVTKLNASGNALLYSTYLGGSGGDKGYGIAVDSAGNAYVTGSTTSGISVSGTGTPFPTTTGAFQAILGGNGFCCVGDGFVARLNTAASGAASLVYSTYLGGTGGDQGLAIAVDALGKVYVTGSTQSAGYFTQDAYDPSINSLQDTFVVKLDTAMSGAASMRYATYLGGAANEQGNGIAVDSLGNAYVAGQTFSSDFPTVNPYDAGLSGSMDGFVAKLNPGAFGAASLVYSTYVGGSGAENATAIAVDSQAYAYVTGSTASVDFPVLNAVDATLGGGGDAFVLKLDPALSGSASLVYGTYLGGAADEMGGGVGVDASATAHVTGYTTSSDFPVLNAYDSTFGGNYDVFVTALVEGTPVATADLSVTNSGAPDPVLVGNSITYTIVATNAGPDAAADVILTDKLASGLAFVSASAGCSESVGTVTCAVGTLASGSTATVTIVATPTATGTQTSVATISSSASDPTPSNDTASASTTVNPAADLSITKSGSPNPVSTGGTLTYTMVVTNAGPSAATGVTLTDPVTGVTYQSVTGPGCAAVRAKGKTTVSCDMGTLASGASAQVSLVVTVPKKPGVTSDTATVSGAVADPNTANNSATATVTIVR